MGVSSAVVGVAGWALWGVDVCCGSGRGDEGAFGRLFGRPCVCTVWLGCVCDHGRGHGMCGVAWVRMAGRRLDAPAHRQSRWTRCGGEGVAGWWCCHQPSHGTCGGCVGCSGGCGRLGAVSVWICCGSGRCDEGAFGSLLGRPRVCTVWLGCAVGLCVWLCDRRCGRMVVLWLYCVGEDGRTAAGRPCSSPVRMATMRW